MKKNMTAEQYRKETNASIITPERLFEDNKSSQQGILEYEQAKRAGQLIAVETCSDARINMGYFLGVPTSEVRSVAAAGSKSHLRFMLSNAGVQAVMVVAHQKCGGLSAAQNPDAHVDHVGHEVVNYVKKRIVDPNPFVQSGQSALRASRLASRPVMAAVVDHESGLITPAAYFFNGTPQSEVFDMFETILKANQQRVDQISRTNPNFSMEQAVQNPNMVTITTSIIPTATRLPGVAGTPNTNFVVHLGYQKKNSEISGVDVIHQEQALAQAQYPLANALHAVSESDPFGNTHTVLIETPRMEWSQHVARALLQKDKAKEWLAKDGRNTIIVAEIQGGVYSQIPLRFDPQA